jgi:hypothetical protein
MLHRTDAWISVSYEAMYKTCVACCKAQRSLYHYSVLNVQFNVHLTLILSSPAVEHVPRVSIRPDCAIPRFSQVVIQSKHIIVTR